MLYKLRKNSNVSLMNMKQCIDPLDDNIRGLSKEMRG